MATVLFIVNNGAFIPENLKKLENQLITYVESSSSVARVIASFYL